MINESNDMIVPFYYEEIRRLECGLLLVKKDGLYGLVTKDNIVVVELIYDKITEFNRGFLQMIRGNEMDWMHAGNEKIIWRSNPFSQ